MNKTVLCVDDSASMRQMVRLTLTGGGYNVVEAVDGRDGLSKANAVTADLVITDLNMPNMDGLSFIRELRGVSGYKGIPIVFLTTESDEDKKSEAKSAGATAWITKPFQPERLLAIAKKVLG
jgi:Response regulator containing CheY-like receiver, AAA-type ATPase, and DNA-binding domains